MPIEAPPAAEVSDAPAGDQAELEPLVIELIVDEVPAATPTAISLTDQDEVDPPTTSAQAEPAPAAPSAALEESGDDDHGGGPGEAGDTGGGGEAGHTEGGGEAGHTGGGGEAGHTGGGTGNPYRVTFDVTWRSLDDSIIPVLDNTLPVDWRSIFDLAAASATGGGKPTAAHCTYPSGSDQLACDFDNPGRHSDVTDGMVVPAKPTATYSVTVSWPTDEWTLEGANAGPYSARDLCPRQGGNHGVDGHGDTHAAEALEGESSTCTHTVVMRQIEVIVSRPESDPPVTEPAPPEAATPATPVEVPTVAPPQVASASVTPRSLPATGAEATTTLAIGALALSFGVGLLVLARRRSTPSLS